MHFKHLHKKDKVSNADLTVRSFFQANIVFTLYFYVDGRILNEKA